MQGLEKQIEREKSEKQKKEKGMMRTSLLSRCCKMWSFPKDRRIIVQFQIRMLNW